MFATIGRTWGLVKSSWGVLQKDRELLLFPVFSMLAVAVLVAVFGAVAYATGSLDRLSGAMNGNNTATAGSGTSINVFDIALYVVGVVAGYFAVIFFNSALIAAALQRLRGGDPTVRSGLAAVTPHILNILGWAIIAASVGLILQAIRSRTDNFLGRLMLSLVGGIWAYMTFFVVPILVVRGESPVSAIKSSAGLFKRSWGEQATSNIGFGLFYVLAALVAFAPAALLFALSPVAGIVAGVVLLFFALAVVSALEGIFKAALFEFVAEGRVGEGFAQGELATAYQRRY